MFYILTLMGLEIMDGDVLCACMRNYVQGKQDLFGTNCSVEFVFLLKCLFYEAIKCLSQGFECIQCYFA